MVIKYIKSLFSKKQEEPVIEPVAPVVVAKEEASPVIEKAPEVPPVVEVAPDKSVAQAPKKKPYKRNGKKKTT
jgi:hypothetical protein